MIGSVLTVMDGGRDDMAVDSGCGDKIATRRPEAGRGERALGWKGENKEAPAHCPACVQSNSFRRPM